MGNLGDLMNASILKVRHDTTVKDAADAMAKHRVGSVLVEKDGRFAGILTETDIVRKAAAVGRDLARERAEAIMSQPIITLERTRAPEDAFDAMGESGVRHIAVTDRGKICGIVSVRDLLLFFRRQSEPRMGID